MPADSQPGRLPPLRVIDVMLAHQNERIGQLADRMVLEWANAQDDTTPAGPEQLKTLAFAAISELLFGSEVTDESSESESSLSTESIHISEEDVRRTRLHQLLHRARQAADETE